MDRAGMKSIILKINGMKKSMRAVKRSLSLLFAAAFIARPASAIWVPPQDTPWQWQLSGLPVDQSVDVPMYDIDLFDNDASVVSSLHAKGRHVVCYIDVGTYEPGRPDSAQFP